jgi:hypothetical protein
MSILQDFANGLIMSLFSIILVFIILYLLTLSVSLLKKTKEVPKESIKQSNHSLKIEDITDPDMMVAALVASIDYQESTKKDVRLVSIKEISK